LPEAGHSPFRQPSIFQRALHDAGACHPPISAMAAGGFVNFCQTDAQPDGVLPPEVGAPGRLKSREDEIIMAEGKRGTSTALGCRPTMNSFPFSRFAAPPGRPARRTVERGRLDEGWRSPRAAASAALPWAVMMMPLGAPNGVGTGCLWNCRPKLPGTSCPRPARRSLIRPCIHEPRSRFLWTTYRESG
jgi:hypothetical protein